jgi:hypothetical protein
MAKTSAEEAMGKASSVAISYIIVKDGKRAIDFYKKAIVSSGLFASYHTCPEDLIPTRSLTCFFDLQDRFHKLLLIIQQLF